MRATHFLPSGGPHRRGHRPDLDLPQPIASRPRARGLLPGRGRRSRPGASATTLRRGARPWRFSGGSRGGLPQPSPAPPRAADGAWRALIAVVAPAAAARLVFSDAKRLRGLAAAGDRALRTWSVRADQAEPERRSRSVLRGGGGAA